MRTATARLVALVLALSACSVAATEVTSTTTTTLVTSTTKTPTTTTIAPTTSTLFDGKTSVVNGLPLDDESLGDRRVLAVKIDNHPRATPQSGIDKADMVVEVIVEGITRFISIWLQSDAEYLGPMRSGRPTDAYLLPAFNEPTFARSGAQDWVQGVIAAQGVRQLGEIGQPATFRISGRSAPHNLYVDTNELRLAADRRDFPDNPPPGPVWEFGPIRDNAGPATHVMMDFSGNIVEWRWDAEQGLWLRSAYGVDSKYRNEDLTEERIGLPVLVSLYVEQYTATPPAGVSGTPLPSSRTTGTGAAFVFAEGKVVEGTWRRDAETDWFTLTDVNGDPILVPPGRVWVSLVPTGKLSYES